MSNAGYSSHDSPEHRHPGSLHHEGRLDDPQHPRPHECARENQSLAEATVPGGTSTQRHYHWLSEEFYFILEGRGTMEIDGETHEVAPGDAILIPSGAWHTITARETLRFLCCCAPAYSHDDTYFE